MKLQIGTESKVVESKSKRMNEASKKRKLEGE